MDNNLPPSSSDSPRDPLAASNSHLPGTNGNGSSSGATHFPVPTTTPFALRTTASPFGGFNTGAPFNGTAAPFGGVTNSPFGMVPQQGGPQMKSDDFSFKDLIELLSHGLRIIRARWYWGLFGALVAGGALGYVLFKRPMEYTAATALLAQSTLDRVINTQADAQQDSDQAKENNLRNQMSMMTSRKFHVRLLAAFTPEERAKIAGPYLKPGQVATDDWFLDYFDNAIAVERERGREYYTISVSHLVPQTAIMVADRTASEYLNYVQQEFREANVEGYELLEKQADALREDIAKSESARLDYQKNNGIISRADNQSILNDRLKQLDSSITETRVKRVGLETQAKQVHSDRAKSAFPWDDSYLATAGNNQQLRQDLDTALAQRAVLAGRYGPNHPKMIDIESQIKAIQTNIEHNFDDATHDLDSQVEVARRTEVLLKKEFEDAFNSSIEIEKLATNYEILSAGVDAKKISLETLEKKIGEASISSKLPNDFMEIVDPAYLVKHKIPKQVIYLFLVGFVSLAAFVTCPLLASSLDERVTGTSDVEKVLNLNMIGAIPVMKLRLEDRPHVVRDKVDPMMGEAFLGILGQLEIGSGRNYPKVVLVTSTLPSEGKSLVASNLASSFTQLGKRTLMVDLDLRRPVQHQLHGTPLEHGFLTWARAGFPMDNLFDPAGPLGIRKLADGTDLIAAGGIDAQPGHYIVSKSIESLLGALKGAYDVVILDTPPAGVFQDALVLARHTTDRLLIARESMPPVVQVRKVIEDFSKAHLGFHGLVLNGFVPATANKKLAYSYKAASKGYGYGGGNGPKTKPKSGDSKKASAPGAKPKVVGAPAPKAAGV